MTPDFSINKSARDILALLDHLNINKVNAIGLSFGGLTLLELARFNPDRIQSAILIGASHNYDGSENDNTFSYENLPTAFKEELKKTHHHGETQVIALFNPNLDYKIRLKDEDLNTFSFRTLVIHGDRDEILGVEPAFALHKNIPNSALWIVPNTGHIPIIGPNKQRFISTSVQFLTLEQ